MRHREAWAVECRAPSAAEWAKEQADAPAEKKTKPSVQASVRTSAPAVVRRSTPAVETSATSATEAELERDILIVASKLKKYIRAKSGMNTSDTALDPLSDCVRAICDRAIRVAGTDGRKTVMDRDIRRAARE